MCRGRTSTNCSLRHDNNNKLHHGWGNIRNQLSLVSFWLVRAMSLFSHFLLACQNNCTSFEKPAPGCVIQNKTSLLVGLSFCLGRVWIDPREYVTPDELRFLSWENKYLFPPLLFFFLKNKKLFDSENKFLFCQPVCFLCCFFFHKRFLNYTIIL